MSTREEDVVTSLFTAITLDYLLLFTNRGQVFRLKVYEIPEVGPTALGKAAVNLLPLQPGEKIRTIMPVHEFSPGLFAVMATRNGIIKKTDLSAYANPRSTGIRAINLDENDELISVVITNGQNDIFLMSRKGKCIRIKEDEFRPLGPRQPGYPGYEHKRWRIGRNGRDRSAQMHPGRYGKRVRQAHARGRLPLPGQRWTGSAEYQGNGS